MSIYGQIDKEIVHLHNGILISIIKEGDHIISNNMMNLEDILQSEISNRGIGSV